MQILVLSKFGRIIHRDGSEEVLPSLPVKENVQCPHRKEETSSYNPARFRGHVIYLCSKSTGAVTSCTRRYFATTRTKPRESLGASVILNDACHFQSYQLGL